MGWRNAARREVRADSGRGGYNKLARSGPSGRVLVNVSRVKKDRTVTIMSIAMLYDERNWLRKHFRQPKYL